MSILEESKPDFPSGIDYIIPYNSKTFLDASINKVIYTLIEAFLLVFLVVYLFLQDFKSTLIPVVPVAIIGTFFLLANIWFLDQHADVICHDSGIGIVVDDAIVVVEAVHAKLDEGAKSAKEATAMSEIWSNYLDYTCNVSGIYSCIF
jgi:HAE1 family hydrophobic/amphiphilic exporter-1